MGRRRKTRLVSTIFMVVALALFLPGNSNAGSLEPSDPPWPTMRTLDEIYNKPVWKMFDKVFVDWPANPRFAVCDNGTTDDTWDDMVLDKETGLVWERDPTRGFWVEKKVNWHEAINECLLLSKGRDGWHLPTVQELNTLLDRAQWWPALPSGHPFINVQADYDNDGKLPFYWTATTYSLDSNKAVLVLFAGSGWGQPWPFLENKNNRESTSYRYYRWCVRGGQVNESQ